jgi:hypothetical protein
MISSEIAESAQSLVVLELLAVGDRKIGSTDGADPVAPAFFVLI